MWTHLEDKTVKARKTHRCDLCELDIPKGSEYIRRTGVDDEFVTLRMHTQCELATQEWTQQDWETGFDGWTFRHEALTPETVAELMSSNPERGDEAAQGDGEGFGDQ